MYETAVDDLTDAGYWNKPKGKVLKMKTDQFCKSFAKAIRIYVQEMLRD